MSPAYRSLAIGSAIVLAVLPLTACGGGGSSHNAQTTVPFARASASPVAGANASGTIIIIVPSDAQSTSHTSRHAAYVSAATTRAAVFIDGATAPAGSTTSCTPSSCTITWVAGLSVPASHTFAIETDNGTKALSEGVQSYAIVSGNNGTLATMTLNGIAANASWSSESCLTAATTCSGTLTVSDAAGNPIVNTSSPLATGYDNGPLTFGSTASGVGTVTVGGTLTQPGSAGTAAYTVHCVVSTGGFLTSMTPASTTGSGDITSGELSNRGLTYPASIAYVPSIYSCSATTMIAETRLYVGSIAAPGIVSVFAAGASGAASTIATIGGGTTGNSRPAGIGVDANQTVFIANNASNAVTVFPGNPVGSVTSTPILTIGGAATALSNPLGVAVTDSPGRIYVVNQTANSLTVYNSYGNATPVATITTGINYPYCVELDSSGRMYVANENSATITIYATNPTGNEAPLTTIGGALTGLTAPTGVALDSSGRIYVSNGNTALVFAAYPAGGNEAPLATISGALTGLSTPQGITVDFAGRIYLANNGSNVLVFPAYPASGNEAPIATINVANPFGLVTQ